MLNFYQNQFANKNKSNRRVLTRTPSESMGTARNRLRMAPGWLFGTSKSALRNTLKLTSPLILLVANTFGFIFELWYPVNPFLFPSPYSPKQIRRGWMGSGKVLNDAI